MKKILFVLLCWPLTMLARQPVSFSHFDKKNGADVRIAGKRFTVTWPAGEAGKGQLELNLDNQHPLFSNISLQQGKTIHSIVRDLDPAFLITIGKRDLVSQNGWNIFFDKVPLKPFQTHRVHINKRRAVLSSTGARTVITIGEISAPGFSGNIEITLYHGSPLLNVAAVMSTAIDSTAIVYDAGLVSESARWRQLSWSDVNGNLQTREPVFTDTAVNEMVKYRTIIGGNADGSLAVFPAPHQYFYPLDEAFNLRFVWHGRQYRKLLDGFGIGIRQDLYGDRRFVPWFNAPPQTQQRLHFFCLLNSGDAASALTEVKRFTNNDRYVALPGYKTLSSHFHNEFIMKVVMAGKPIPAIPDFVSVFKNTGIDIVHLGEFHYTAHPKGPDSLRLKELHALFQQCERLSDSSFLLLPGEEPNEFFGGHWLQFFPRPVYWIMSRNNEQPFVSTDSRYGTVYRIANAAEMWELLQKENGLAWTAHPRTKGSTGYPDTYNKASFFTGSNFLGAAWKPMPADLSLPVLGKRVLDLLDDMNNWGYHKKVLAEADLFSIEPENEMYAHLNVNYLQLDKLPAYRDGWQPVIDALQKGKFFSGTGEVLIPSFTVNDKTSGDTVTLSADGNAHISFSLQWTFPLNYASIISGDGSQVYRHTINLDSSRAFGKNEFKLSLPLTGRKWVRLEVWDAAANGAFTQTVWLQPRRD